MRGAEPVPKAEGKYSARRRAVPEKKEHTTDNNFFEGE